MSDVPPPPPPGAYPPPGPYPPAGGFGRPGGYGGPPTPYGGSPYPPNVPNYLAQAILTTLFCCLPAGIVSIVFASQVNGKLAAGDYPGALDSSQKARTWAWVSFGVGLAAAAVWVIVVVDTAASSNDY